MHAAVEHNNSRDVISVDCFPHLRVTEPPIGHPPAGACFTDNYFASPLPFPEDPATNTMPPLPPPSSPSPSPHDHRIPRACHGVERRQRPRPSSRGGTDYFSKLTRAERAAAKKASSRRVTFAQHTHEIASSSLWSPPNDAPPAHTATPKPKRHRPPTPLPISAGHVTNLSHACASFDFERDMSPGFDADVEFEPAEMTPRHHRAHVGTKERLTIIVPGGKSEAYVAMAFERSCSLADDNGDNDDVASTVHHGMSSSFIPPLSLSSERLLLASDEATSRDTGKGKTGLKIKIPVPNPLFMLSLRLASSCHVSDQAAIAECPPCPGTRTRFLESGYPSTGTSSSGSGSSSDNVMMMMSQDHGQGPDSTSAAYRSLSPQGRVARRVARRAALAPYCVNDRLHVVPNQNALPRPALTY
jgi:hypothetical protein